MHISRKIWMYIIGGIVGVSSVFAYVFWPKDIAPSDLYTVGPQTVSRTITVSGSVKAPKEIKLAFKAIGRIDEIDVKAGDNVQVGTELARLEIREAENAIQQAAASVRQAQAKLSQFAAGITDSQKQLLQTKIDSAQKNLNEVRKSGDSQIASAKQSLVSALVTYENAQSNLDEGKKLFTQVDSQTTYRARLSAQTGLNSVESLLEESDLILGITDKYKHNNDAFENDLSALNPTYKSQARDEFYLLGNAVRKVRLENDDVTFVQQTLPVMQQALHHVDVMSNVLANTIASANLSLDTLNGYQNTIITLRGTLLANKLAIEASLNDITNFSQSGSVNATGLQNTIVQLENALKSADSAFKNAQADLTLVQSQVSSQIVQAENALQLAQKELDDAVAPKRGVDLDIYRSAVVQAQSQLEQARINRDNMILFAPLDGVVGKIWFENGETVGSGQTVITLIAGEPDEVQVNFPETDIAYIYPDKELTFTFDGFPQEFAYSGKVRSIEPSPTDIQGVVYYTSEVTFDPNAYDNLQPRSGMTVNIDIVAEQLEAAVAIPYSAIKEDTFGKRVVAKIITNTQSNKILLVEVTTGFEGDDTVEIISGLKSGDTILFDVQSYEK